MSIWDDIASAFELAAGIGGTSQETAAGTSAVNAAGDVTGDVSAIGEVGNAFTSFFAYITNVAMWRSLGWLLLGVALMIFGVALLLRKSIATTIGAAAL